MNFLKGSLFRRNTEPEELEPMEESGGGILAVWGSPGCGKTVTAVKIAKHLAAQKKNTVLLLCDMTAPMMPCICAPSELEVDKSLGSIFAAQHISVNLIKHNLTTLKRLPHLTMLGLRKKENEYTYAPCTKQQAEELIRGLREIVPYVKKEDSMSSYIHFTEEQKQRAAAVDLEEFLRCRGEKLLSSGREKRLASDHSVTVRGNEWYDHAEERGGHAVSFVQRFYSLSYPDAVTMLLGGELGTAYPSAGERTEEPVKPFALPPANKDMRRVFAYLIKHRGIAKDVVAHFAKAGLLYEDAEYHNAVFVGTDAEGVPRHAHKRSANSYGKAFRLNVEGSDPRYSFHHVGTDRSLYVFEAPIDLLSFITLYPENWQRHSYVACCGTSIQPVLQMLEQAPQLDTVLLCLDNDEAGHQASRRMREQLEARYSVERLIPENKDWNDDLTLSDENAQGFAMNELR